MNETEEKIRHLLDICRRAEKTGRCCYSSFLTPAEQDDFAVHPSAAFFQWSFEGGYENAERRILAAGEDEYGNNETIPLRVIRAEPQNEKFAENLSHRDYLGAVMNLGIERSTIGDIQVRGQKAWIVCLEHVSQIILSDLGRVRRTAIRTSPASPDDEDMRPEYQKVYVHTASERIDSLAAEFSGISRTQAASLFSSGKIFVNGRCITDRSIKLHPGDILSVRGFGKGKYEGIERATRKGRLVAVFQKYI